MSSSTPLVARTRAGEPPPEPGAPGSSDSPDRPLRRLKLTYELDAADAEIVRRALRLLRLAGEHGAETTAADLLVELARRFLGSAEHEAAEADGGAAPASRRPAIPPQPAGEARYRVVLHTCARCEKDPHVGDLGVDAATAAMADCDSERVDLTGDTASGQLTRNVPPAVRRRVIHRHGDRCAVPYCRHTQFLDIHHIVPRSIGETRSEFGLLPLCPMHHRAIHEGTLLLYGDVPRGVRFLHPDGQAFGPGAEPPGANDDTPDVLDRLRAAIDGPLGATLPVAAGRAGLSRGRAAHGLNVLHAEGEAVEGPLGDWYRVDRLLPVVRAWAG